MVRYLFIILFILPLTVVLEKTPSNIYNSFNQHSYHVQLQRMQLLRSNKNLTDIMKITTFKYNRTSAAVNFTMRFLIDKSEKLEVVVQAYKFSSNEYRLFPVRFEVNWCKAFDANIIGVQNALNCGNFTGCPMNRKDIYHICYWSLDESKMPPGVPTGQYKIQMTAIYFSKDVMVVDMYINILNSLYIF